LRALASSLRILTAAPDVAARIEGEADPACLSDLPCLAFGADDSPDVWRLIGPDQNETVVRITPRLICGELFVLRAAAVAGLGVALIPDHFCREELLDGRLVRLLPDWSKQSGLVHAVFTTRRGLTPAVRALIDHLAIGFKDDQSMDSPSNFTTHPPRHATSEASA
jgi:DNA-binding transcriptional LysR family regulator